MIMLSIDVQSTSALFTYNMYVSLPVLLSFKAETDSGSRAFKMKFLQLMLIFFGPMLQPFAFPIDTGPQDLSQLDITQANIILPPISGRPIHISPSSLIKGDSNHIDSENCMALEPHHHIEITFKDPVKLDLVNLYYYEVVSSSDLKLEKIKIGFNSTVTKYKPNVTAVILKLDNLKAINSFSVAVAPQKALYLCLIEAYGHTSQKPTPDPAPNPEIEEMNMEVYVNPTGSMISPSTLNAASQKIATNFCSSLNVKTEYNIILWFRDNYISPHTINFQLRGTVSDESPIELNATDEYYIDEYPSSNGSFIKSFTPTDSTPKDLIVFVMKLAVPLLDCKVQVFVNVNKEVDEENIDVDHDEQVLTDESITYPTDEPETKSTPEDPKPQEIRPSTSFGSKLGKPNFVVIIAFIAFILSCKL